MMMSLQLLKVKQVLFSRSNRE